MTAPILLNIVNFFWMYHEPTSFYSFPSLRKDLGVDPSLKAAVWIVADV
jgi:hypothetical protein